MQHSACAGHLCRHAWESTEPFQTPRWQRKMLIFTWAKREIFKKQREKKTDKAEWDTEPERQKEGPLGECGPLLYAYPCVCVYMRASVCCWSFLCLDKKRESVKLGPVGVTDDWEENEERHTDRCPNNDTESQKNQADTYTYWQETNQDTQPTPVYKGRWVSSDSN